MMGLDPIPNLALAADELPPPVTAPTNSSPGRPTASFAEALKVWAKIGFISFGGPAGQIALMHRMVVEEKRWVDERRFLHALNFCMLLPGPEAQQLATYTGWMMHGIRGGLAAGLLFVLPGAIVILALSAIYAAFSAVPLLAALFLGIKCAVLIIVVEAVLRIGKRILKSPLMHLIALLAFVGIFAFNLPFPLIILSAGVVGALGIRLWPEQFQLSELEADTPTETAHGAHRSLGRSAGIVVLGLAAWALPVILAALLLGPDHVFVDEGLFFSKLAVVTFGGAYAVLAYMAQQAVEVYGWLNTGEMMVGLGLAESTPGPLILVTQFVGFLGAYRQPGPLDPAVAAILGSGLTLWVTFVPCFLWIFLGAPYVERLRSSAALSAALSAITAAVVGVIVNLAVWFGLQVSFAEIDTFSASGMRFIYPVWASVQWPAVLLTALAGLALLRFQANVILTLVGCALLSSILMRFV